MDYPMKHYLVYVLIHTHLSHSKSHCLQLYQGKMPRATFARKLITSRKDTRGKFYIETKNFVS